MGAGGKAGVTPQADLGFRGLLTRTLRGNPAPFLSEPKSFSLLLPFSLTTSP